MRRRCRSLAFLALLLLVLSLSTHACDQSETAGPLALEITSPKDNADLNVNVVKVMGTVSDGEAEVTVNGAEAHVSDDGAFYAYLDLPPGESTIEVVAVRDREQVSRSVTVNFAPPLAVYFWLGDTSDDVDYTQTPVPVAGLVNHPEATVNADGVPMEVADDGTFSGEVRLSEGPNTITAVATLGSEQDEWTLTTEPYPGGGLIVVPGLGSGWHLYEQRVKVEDTLELRAGETKSMDVTVESGKADYPREFHYEIYSRGPGCGGRTPELERCKGPLPEGLKVTIEPQRFTEYANTTYHSMLIVSAADGLEPGEYHFTLGFEGGYRGQRRVTVHVKP